jgi:DNA-binding NarL/FixJ family response regulator
VIRVVVVDDQTLVRQGIRSLLANVGDVDVVAECADGDDAIARVPALAPDVLLLDVRMPGRGGLAVVEALGAALPPTLLLTTFDDDDVVLAGMRLGARGYLQKDVSCEQLVDGIRALAAGGTCFRPAVTARVARALDADAAPAWPAVDRMTRRELEILRLLAGGYSNREIADALAVAEGTIKNHVSSVLAKLGVRDRTRAVLKAIDAGYL